MCAQVIFGVFVTVWTTVYLENWKRFQATLAHRWGMEGACPSITQVSRGMCAAPDASRPHTVIFSRVPALHVEMG